MRKAKSRNFILTVCGVLITMLLGIVLAKTIVSVLDEVNNGDISQEVYTALVRSV